MAHERFGSSSDPSINGRLHFPNDLDGTLGCRWQNSTRADHNNRPSNAISFMPAIASTSGRLHSEFVRLLFLQAHRETDRFFAASGVQLAHSTSGQVHYLALGSGLRDAVCAAGKEDWNGTTCPRHGASGIVYLVCCIVNLCC
jgi:hypothetical protein